MKKFIRYFLFTILALTILASILTLLIALRKNEIANKLIGLANDEIAGTISVDRIELGSLLNYPNIKIRLEQVEIIEPIESQSYQTPVIFAEVVEVSSNLTNIFSNRLEIDWVKISGGNISIVRSTNGKTNISKAFYILAKDSLSKHSSAFFLGIDSIFIEDFQFEIQDESIEKQLPILIEQLHGKLVYDDHHVFGTASISSHFEEFYITDSLSLTDKTLSIIADYNVELQHKTVSVVTDKMSFQQIGLQTDLTYDYGDLDKISLKFSTKGKSIKLTSDFYKNYDKNTTAKEPIRLFGALGFQSTINWQSNANNSFLENIDAKLELEGKDLTVKGMDVDQFIQRFKRSQNFNLVDVGAVLFVGPLGIVVSKGSDYTVLVFGNAGEESTIGHFVSNWQLTKGKLSTKDVGMSTENNLVCLNGWYNLKEENLDFRIHLVDRYGCSLMNQHYFGTAQQPEVGNVKILKTFFGPVTNLFRDIGLSNCEIVYTGKIEHPALKAKRLKKETKEKEKKMRNEIK